MDLPAVINVAGVRYRVAVEHDVDTPLHKHDAYQSGTLGATDLDLQTIIVRGPERMGDDQARDTLLHEVLHAVAAAGHLGLKEREISVLATLLLDTLRRNPLLVASLLTGVTPESDE